MKAMPITKSYGMGSVSEGGMVMMTDSPLFSMRRRTLYVLADAWGLEYSKDAPATEMRQMLMARGIDGSKEPPKPYAAKPKEDMEIMPEMQAEPATPAAPLPYEEWKFLELRQECKRKGIKYVNTDKKAALLEKLKPAEVLYGQIAS